MHKCKCTLKQILSQIHTEDWFFSLDLKDAYFHIQIAPHHRQFLRLSFEWVSYQYTILPFGLSPAPRTCPIKMFQKLPGLMAAASPVLQLGLLRMCPFQFWLKPRVLSHAWHQGHLLIKVDQAWISALAPWTNAHWMEQEFLWEWSTGGR